MARADVVIALDLGTSCGWAVFENDKRVDSGTWRLVGKKGEPRGLRWNRFEGQLWDLINRVSGTFDQVLIAYEQVRKHAGTTAAHVYGGLVATLEHTLLDFADAQVMPVEVSTWKKLATGRGNASKEFYVRSANKRHKLRLNVKKHEDEAAALGIGYAAVRLSKEKVR